MMITVDFMEAIIENRFLLSRAILLMMMMISLRWEMDFYSIGGPEGW